MSSSRGWCRSVRIQSNSSRYCSTSGRNAISQQRNGATQLLSGSIARPDGGPVTQIPHSGGTAFREVGPILKTGARNLDNPASARSHTRPDIPSDPVEPFRMFLCVFRYPSSLCRCRMRRACRNQASGRIPPKGHKQFAGQGDNGALAHTTALPQPKFNEILGILCQICEFWADPFS